jgi:hypothetical protein
VEVLKRLLVAVGLLLAIQAFTASITNAQAFSMARKAIVADRLMFIPRVSAGGISAQKRANHVNDRIASIIGTERLSRNNIYLARHGNSYGIMVGRSLLYTVTPRDARANHTTTDRLAKRWLNNVRAALPQSRPPAA